MVIPLPRNWMVKQNLADAPDFFLSLHADAASELAALNPGAPASPAAVSRDGLSIDFRGHSDVRLGCNVSFPTSHFAVPDLLSSVVTLPSTRPTFIRSKPSRGASLLNQTLIWEVSAVPFSPLPVYLPAIQLALYSLPATLIFSVPWQIGRASCRER